MSAFTESTTIDRNLFVYPGAASWNRETSFQNRQHAMRIAAGMPFDKETALATLDYARKLILDAHASLPVPEDQSEAA